MEFVVPAADTSAFFPIDVKFSASKTYCDIKVPQKLIQVVKYDVPVHLLADQFLRKNFSFFQVVAVQPSNGGGALKYSGKCQLVVDSYQVV